MGSGDSQSIFLCIPKANKERNTMTDYITIEEFIHKIEELGFTYERGAFRLYIYIEGNGCPVASVNLYQPLQVDTCYDNLNYKNPTHLALYELVNRYTRALLNKRKTEKRYRLKLNIDDRINMLNGGCLYFARSKSGSFYLSLSNLSKMKRGLYKTTFTQAEIDEMGDVTRGFVKEEV
jgi:hypothetical protein